MDTEPDNQPPSLLLVDDREANLLALEAVFEDSGYRLVRANSGRQALKRLLTEEFAAVLLDVQMPGLDGFETATMIRRRQQSRHTPIIFITAINKEEQYVFRGYAAGAVDYIFKPFDPEILRAKVAVFAELFIKNRQLKLQAEQLQQAEQRERERSIAELKRSSEARYRNLADAMPQLVWTSTPDGVIGYVNERRGRYGAGQKETKDKGIEDLLHPDDMSCLRACYDADAKNDGGRCEARLLCDGTYRWHLIQVVPERDQHGRLLSWLGTATDIDDAKKTAEALTAEKERLAITLRSIGDGVITTDVEGRIEVMNRAAESMTGWTQEHAAGRKLAEVFRIESDGRESSGDRLGKGLEGPEGEGRLVGREGNSAYVAHTLSDIRAPDDRIVGKVLVFRDVTDKRCVEEERIKASKLESVGVLAGAIAHDFNNILTAILGNISLAKLYLDSPERAAQRLTEAEKASLWARDLTQQLLTFSRGGAPVRKTIVLGEIVRAAAQFAARGSHARCDLVLPENLWPVDADEGQIRQVLHNLVLNAQQAMPNGGCIRVTAENVTLRPGGRLPLKPGRYVRLCCEDQGHGIPAEHLGKIFDPYFTTKQRGSGLGLTTCYSIIKRHDGLITVESEMGRGARFWIHLPASNGKPTAETQPAALPLLAASGRILVMDDEAYIRDLLASYLSYAGHEVALAIDGTQAIELYREARATGRPFDLVIMDLVVPGGMGGLEAIQRLLEIDPNVCAVVSSGYSNDPIMSDFARYGFRDAVGKPYKNEELHRVVQRLLTERRASAA